LAESYSAIPASFLAITHGVSAVGKSHVAMRLVESLGAIRLRSDVERKRMLGEQSADLKGHINAGIYTTEAAQATYQRLHQLATRILQAGFAVVIDAAYLKHEQRQAAQQVAEQTGAALMILDCHAPDAVISTWLAQRQAAQQDPSDATQAIIDAQHASREALDSAEQAVSIRIDTHDTDSLSSLITRLRNYLPGI
jgi:predicted kinase